MKFVERLKKIQIEKIDTEIQTIEQSTEDLKIKQLELKKQIELQEQQINEVLIKLNERKREIIPNKELEDIRKIYDFLSNLSKIKRISEILKKQCRNIYSIHYKDFSKIKTQIKSREHLLEFFKSINTKIEELESLAEDNPYEVPEKGKKKNGLFERIFRRRINAILALNESSNVFKEFKSIISNFKQYYDLTLRADRVDNLHDKVRLEKILIYIGALNKTIQNGVELYDYDRGWLERMQPSAFFKEVAKFYANTSNYTTIIQNFENKLPEFEQMYQQHPEIFDIEYLKRILNENERKLNEIQNLRKILKTKKVNLLNLNKKKKL